MWVALTRWRRSPIMTCSQVSSGTSRTKTAVIAFAAVAVAALATPTWVLADQSRPGGVSTRLPTTVTTSNLTGSVGPRGLSAGSTRRPGRPRRARVAAAAAVAAWTGIWWACSRVAATGEPTRCRSSVQPASMAGCSATGQLPVAPGAHSRITRGRCCIRFRGPIW